MDVLQFVATVLVSAIAPLFLYLQQKQQNKREVSLRELDSQEASKEAQRAGAAKLLADRRESYAAVLRALGRYRAGAAPAMANIEGAARGTSETRSMPTQSLRGSGSLYEFPAEELAEAHDAIAVARLWAPNVGVHWVTGLEDALRDSAAAPIFTSGLTWQEALSRWEDLKIAVDNFARGAEADLRAHGSDLLAVGSTATPGDQVQAVTQPVQSPALPSAT